MQHLTTHLVEGRPPEVMAWLVEYLTLNPAPAVTLQWPGEDGELQDTCFAGLAPEVEPLRTRMDVLIGRSSQTDSGVLSVRVSASVVTEAGGFRFGLGPTLLMITATFAGNGKTQLIIEASEFARESYSGYLAEVLQEVTGLAPAEPASVPVPPAEPTLRDEAKRLGIRPPRLLRWRAIRELHPHCENDAAIVKALRTYGRDPADSSPVKPEKHMDVDATTVEDDIKQMKRRGYWKG